MSTIYPPDSPLRDTDSVRYQSSQIHPSTKYTRRTGDDKITMLPHALLSQRHRQYVSIVQTGSTYRSLRRRPGLYFRLSWKLNVCSKGDVSLILIAILCFLIRLYFQFCHSVVISHSALFYLHTSYAECAFFAFSWRLLKTRSSAIAEGPRDASCQLKSCQLPRNSAETTFTTSPDQIDGMKLEI